MDSLQMYEQLKSIIQSGQIDTLKILLNGHSDKINDAMSMAAYCENLEVMNYLFQCGADIHKDTLIDCVVMLDKFKSFKFLVEHGAEIKDYHIRSFKRNGDLHILKYWIEELQLPILDSDYYHAANNDFVLVLVYLIKQFNLQIDNPILIETHRIAKKNKSKETLRLFDAMRNGDINSYVFHPPPNYHNDRIEGRYL